MKGTCSLIYFLILLGVLLLLSVFFCIKFALIIIKIQDTIEYSLDKIDDKYNKISQISEIPVFLDSPEIKSLLTEVLSVKNIIYEISYDLANISTKDNDKDEESYQIE